MSFVRSVGNIDDLAGRGAVWLARLVWDQEVGGSNPLAPTIFRKKPFGEYVEGPSRCPATICDYVFPFKREDNGSGDLSGLEDQNAKCSSPFREELDALFRDDRKLLWKVFGAVLVGSCISVKWWSKFLGDQEVALTECLIVTAGTITVSVMAVLMLSLRDVVKRRIADGTPVSLCLRWYLAGGVWSLLLWIVTALAGTFLGIVLWGEWSAMR